MSTTHKPMHPAGACELCDRRRVRLAAYADRMAFRASKAGQKAAAAALMARIAREKGYRDKQLRPRRDRAANVARMARRAWRRIAHARRPAVAAEDPST